LAIDCVGCGIERPKILHRRAEGFLLFSSLIRARRCRRVVMRIPTMAITFRSYGGALTPALIDYLHDDAA